MVKTKIALIAVLVLLFAGVILATSVEYDYNLAENYNDINFYLTSDPKRWDYDKVNWNMVDFSRTELYNSQDFYDNLPDEKYSQLDYNKVDYSKIKDHNKIDTAKYFKDKGCIDCSLERRGINLKFSKNKIIHPNGKAVSVPGIYPKGTKYIGRADIIEVIIPGEVDLVNVPQEDDVVINTNGRDLTIGNIYVNGKLSYKKGKPYVGSGDKATIKNIVITSWGGDIDIYFDGVKHQNNFVSFGDKKFISAGEGVDIKFLEGNNYFSVTNGIQNDLLSIELKSGAFEVEKRNKINNLPLVKTEGEVFIQNNENNILVSGTEVEYSTDKRRYLLPEERGAVCFELEVGGDNTKHWFFDDNHNIIVQDQQSYTETNSLREKIKEEYGVTLKGYFSPHELFLFQNNLNTLQQNGFDIKDLTINSVDRRIRGKNWISKSSHAFVDRYGGNTLFWTPLYDLNEEYLKNIMGDYERRRLLLFTKKVKSSEAIPLYIRNLYHETGHIINNQYSKSNNKVTINGKEPSPEEIKLVREGKLKFDSIWDSNTFEGKWIKTLRGSGINIYETQQERGNMNPSKFIFDKSGESGNILKSLFSDTKPNTLLEDAEGKGWTYATHNIGESQAELFTMMNIDPDWFTNPTRVKYLPPTKRPQDILSIRQNLRALYLNVD
jgi:hypothetical protein